MKTILSILLLGFIAAQVDAADVHYNLTVGEMGTTTMHDGQKFPIWGFRLDGGMMSPYKVPGPVLRAKEGDHVFLHFNNTSNMAHTIHPHGLDVSQAMDGVPHTSREIPAMGTYIYDFIAPHAGTYAYHCHVQTVRHFQMGMYGAVVIDPANGSRNVWTDGPAYDLERIWVTGEYVTAWHNLPDNDNIVYPFNEYDPNYFIVNGMSATQTLTDPTSTATLKAGQRLVVRVVNMGYLAHRFRWNGLPVTVVSSDGRPLPTTMQQVVTEWTVYPGERYDFIIAPIVANNYSVEIEYLSPYNGVKQGAATVPITITESPLGVEDEHQADAPFRLDQNYPNPFRTPTQIAYQLAQAGRAQLRIYDVTGRLIRNLADSPKESGNYIAEWDGLNDSGHAAASGVYFYELTVDSRVRVIRQMTLLK